ncbi:MAG: hypothetical protein WC641_01400 [Patescibacteria group bacterium]
MTYPHDKEGFTKQLIYGSGYNMKRRAREKTKQLTFALLEILALGGLITLIGLISNGYGSTKLFGKFGRYSAWRIREAVRRMKLLNLINYDTEDDESPIVLTPKGMKRYKIQSLTEIFSARPKKWDHMWRMLFFDIPEAKGRRKAFRRTLKRIGLYPLQESVYITPHDYRKELMELSRAYGVTSDVVMTTTMSLGGWEKIVRDHFFECQKQPQ